MEILDWIMVLSPNLSDETNIIEIKNSEKIREVIIDERLIF